MKKLAIATIIIWSLTNVSFGQIIYPPNADLNYAPGVPGTPNGLIPDSWTELYPSQNPASTPDVLRVGLNINGVPLKGSNNGGTWAHFVHKPNLSATGSGSNNTKEGIQTTITGLTVGQTYMINFEQALMLSPNNPAFMNKAGRIKVTLGVQTINGPTINLPASNSMTDWQDVSVGPFTATATSMTLAFESEATTPGGSFQHMTSMHIDGIYLRSTNTDPLANDATVSICEGISNGILVHTVVANDADLDVLTYSISSGNTANAFAINTANGNITVNDASQINATTTPSYSLVIDVSDGNGGTDQATITINVNPTPTFTFAKTDETCAGGGTITVTSGIGTTPFQYSNNGGTTFQASNFFTGLTANTYSIVIRDANTCTSSQNATINNIVGPTIDNTTDVDPTCGNNNGSITVNASGGTAPILYNINGGTYLTSNLFSGLAAGTYTMGIRDANLCTATLSVTISNISSFTVLSYITTDVTCAVTGSITINTVGGANPVEYSINNGATFQTSNVFNGLIAGIYPVVIRDANTCSITQNVIINNVPSFNINSINTTDVTCTTLGTLDISIAGGAPPFSYSIDGGMNFQTSSSFTNMAAGIYDVVINDNNSCSMAQSATINTVAPFNVDAVNTTDETCTALGSVSITASGGTPPIEYSINGGPFGASGNFTNLAAANYSIVIRDGSCSVNQSATVNLILPPVIDSIVVVSDSCTACQGSVNIFASGGTNPLTFSADGGSTFQNTGDYNNLCANNFSLQINDANGCVVNANTQVLDLGTPADATITAPADVCITDGLISFTAPTLGGVWSGNGINTTTGVFDPVAAGPGTHAIAYFIGGACGDNDNVNITVTDTVNPNINAIPPVCIADIPLNILANISGGVWTGNGITDAVNGTFDPGSAGAGSHTIFYTITGNCIDVDSINIVVSDTLTPLINPLTTQCNGNNPFQLVASIPGGTWSGNGITDATAGTFDPAIANVGTHTITYTINIGACSSAPAIDIEVLDSKNAAITPAGPFCSIEAPSTLIAVDPNGTWTGNGVNPNTGSFDPATAGAGIHQIIYTLAGNCGDADTINVEVIQQPDATISAAPPMCAEGDPVQLIVATNGGLWSGNGVDDTGLFDPVVAGNYTITYSIPGFCGNFDQVTIVVEENPIIEVSSNINNTCSGTEVTISYTSTLPLNNCLWDFGDGTTDTTCNVTTHAYYNVGCYDATVRGDSPAGCRAKKIKSDLVCVNPDPVAAFEPSKTTVKASYPNILFNNLSQNAVSYSWDFAGIGNSTQTNPSYKFPEEKGTYDVCLEATSQYGCIDVVCHEIYVEEDILINVPNAFTPNGDGLNDKFDIILNGFGEKPIFYIQIWNRWGELVFQSSDAFDSWAGITKDKDASSNTFVWKLFAKDEKGNNHELIGHVSVLN